MFLAFLGQTRDKFLYQPPWLDTLRYRHHVTRLGQPYKYGRIQAPQYSH